jgi:hypothetical protein
MFKYAINCVTIVLILCGPAVGKTKDAHRHAHVRRVPGAVAIGDSLALGFGQASGFETHAKVGEPSCPTKSWRGVLNMVPSKHYRFALLSAGTNDPPGPCIEAIRIKVQADQVIWVIPINGARQHVLSVAQAHHDDTLSYTPGPNWPHPRAYWNVLRKPR